MAKLRERRRQAGQKQVTAYLDAEASALLNQMVEFSKKSRGRKPLGTLISDAISMLAWDYEYWGVRRRSEWDYEDERGPLSSHYEDWRGRYEENPSFDNRPAPPWIMEDERRAAVELAEDKKRSRTLDDDGLLVYRKGGRVTGDEKKR